MKKLIYWILCIIFLICLIYIFISAKNKYCYSYKSLDLTQMDSLKVQYAKKLIVDRAWEMYRPEPNSDYITDAVYLSKYDIKDMGMLIDMIKKSDRKKSFVENFNVIAGVKNRLEIFADGKNVKLPENYNGVSDEELKQYKQTTKHVYDILDPYITPKSTIIIVTYLGYGSAYAEVFPVSSMVFYKAQDFPKRKIRIVEGYFNRFIYADKIRNPKYILNLNYYDFREPLLCCDQYSIDEKLTENIKNLSESGNLNQNGERMDYFDYSVNLNQLNGANEQDNSFFRDNFPNYNHIYRKEEEISLAGKYRSIIEMQHDVGISLPIEFGIKVNACNFK
ncbi:hypothetical protein F975_02942 [Acinetobacter sp. ANC 3789]|uniref:hypothetical protein n=1 Tax=Acinetobacter sp. ANC 3789 TaxID=1217714 RepID=UPI0002CEB247|nr:hypothetical protein [Acinetobacter sp. ANC 3789]ENU79250.1 hypothetical protein F975_02942 [Acinetobacter sp. ANC 3789]